MADHLLPTRRASVEGETYEGDRLRLSFSIAKKMYRCPDCKEPIGIGAEHIFVAFLDADPPWDHEHWHSHCAERHLLRALATARSVPAAKAPRARRRGAQPRR